MSDAQIAEFLERYAADPQARSLVAELVEEGSALLRLPLFLTFVVRLTAGALETLRLKLGSYSGLVVAYVDHLFEREAAKQDRPKDELLELREEAALVAEILQRCGQAVSRDEVLEDLGARKAGHRLDELGEIGLLAADRRYVRFWHHSLQEHFFALSVARSWKAPGLLRARAARRSLRLVRHESALRHFITFVEDPRETARCMRHVLGHRPRLAASWADDLAAEQRAEPAQRLFMRTTARLLDVSLGYARLAATRSGGAIKLSGVWLVLFVLVVFGAASVWPHVPPLAAQIGSATFLALWAASLLYVAFAIHDRGWAEDMLAAMADLRTARTKEWAASSATRLSLAWWADRQLRFQCHTVSGSVNESQIVQNFLASEPAPHPNVHQLAFAPDQKAQQLLFVLIQSDSADGRSALPALGVRAVRFPRERSAIVEALRWVLASDSLDMKMRGSARAVLLRLDEPSDVPSGFVMYRLKRALYYITVMLSLWVVSSALGLIVALPVLYVAKAHPTAAGVAGLAVTTLGYLLNGLLALVVFRDARRLGARG